MNLAKSLFLLCSSALVTIGAGTPSPPPSYDPEYKPPPCVLSRVRVKDPEDPEKNKVVFDWLVVRGETRANDCTDYYSYNDYKNVFRLTDYGYENYVAKVGSLNKWKETAKEYNYLLGSEKTVYIIQAAQSRDQFLGYEDVNLFGRQHMFETAATKTNLTFYVVTADRIREEVGNTMFGLGESDDHIIVSGKAKYGNWIQTGGGNDIIRLPDTQTGFSKLALNKYSPESLSVKNFHNGVDQFVCNGNTNELSCACARVLRSVSINPNGRGEAKIPVIGGCLDLNFKLAQETGQDGPSVEQSIHPVPWSIDEESISPYAICDEQYNPQYYDACVTGCGEDACKDIFV